MAIINTSAVMQYDPANNERKITVEVLITGEPQTWNELPARGVNKKPKYKINQAIKQVKTAGDSTGVRYR